MILNIQGMKERRGREAREREKRRKKRDFFYFN
jgi:hypothetical protein